MSKMLIRDILELTFFSDDLDEEVTIRGWLSSMLAALWDEGEGFSGKRPLGNSGWEYAPVAMLIEYGALDGEVQASITTVTKDGLADETETISEVIRFDQSVYRTLIADAIIEMGNTPPASITTPPYTPTTPAPWEVVPNPNWWETWTVNHTDPKEEIDED